METKESRNVIELVVGRDSFPPHAHIHTGAGQVLFKYIN